jgi:hypothetical protein
MSEYGEMDPSEWPDPFDPDAKTTKKIRGRKLPANARIALMRLRCALKKDALALKNAEYIEPRARLPEDAAPITAPILSQIVTAIAALKAAGVLVRGEDKPAPIEAHAVEDDRGTI